jgi:MarR family transcriptional regulator, lower aerobic nicotinate degradation pathway regulator
MTQHLHINVPPLQQSSSASLNAAALFKTSSALRIDIMPAAASETLHPVEDLIGFRLRKAHQRAVDIFNAVMAQHGVTATQFTALAKLHEAGPLSQNHLGRLTAMDPATIFGVVGRLSKRGYVKQSVHQHDARLVVLSLTDEGKDAALAMREAIAEVSRRILAPLDDNERGTFMMLLAKMV